MLPLSSRAIPTSLARSTADTFRYVSSQAQSNASSVSLKVPDPHLEMRRAARLAQEAKQTKAKTKGLPSPGTANNLASGSSTPNATRLQELSRRNRVRSRSSGPARGTERSRQAASRPGAAEAIMAFSRHDASRHQKQPMATSPGGDMTLDQTELPSIGAPDPIVTNVKTLLNNVPDLTSSLPRLLPPRKLRQAPATWVKQVYGGDYSQWQLDSQSYREGARGLRSTYAEIILNRNPTVSSKSQKVLIAAIKRATKEA